MIWSNYEYHICPKEKVGTSNFLQKKLFFWKIINNFATSRDMGQLERVESISN